VMIDFSFFHESSFPEPLIIRQHHFFFIQNFENFAKILTTRGAAPVSLTPVVNAKNSF
jgi:hypothetical protein